MAGGFGKDLEGYVLIMRYRGQVEDPAFTYSAIDAAAMLARTYRTCQSAEPDVPETVSFTDREDIADWALEDVALMNQLGIMKGVEAGAFRSTTSV